MKDFGTERGQNLTDISCEHPVAQAINQKCTHLLIATNAMSQVIYVLDH